MTAAAPAATIRPRERDALLQSLRAGVVPRAGQQHIQVGRAKELQALVQDLSRIGDGGSAIRFVIGEYGSGKTFFLHLVRSIALEKKLVTMHADLSPDRRLHGTGGQARAFYAELTRNVATRAKPEGGAMASIVERFVSSAVEEARANGATPATVIRSRLSALSELVGGYDFAQVIEAYWEGHDGGNEARKESAIRWLRGEFATRTDARAELGVRTIVDDANVYDQLKLFALFVRQAGYAGLLVCADEMVNLYKLTNTKARTSNYEQVLRILNDCLQGGAQGLGFLLGGTPEFLTDTRRGLYSYAALESRLRENAFAKQGLVDMSGPVIRLASLAQEDLFVLLRKIRHVHASGDPAANAVPDEAITAFMDHCKKRVGETYFRTPRSSITAFVNLLAILDQNPGASWQATLELTDVERETDPNAGEVIASPGEDDDELTAFKL